VATTLVRRTEHLVQRELSLRLCPAAELLVGGVRHDAVEPGPECRSPRKVSIFRTTVQNASCTTSSASWPLPVMPLARR